MALVGASRKHPLATLDFSNDLLGHFHIRPLFNCLLEPIDGEFIVLSNPGSYSIVISQIIIVLTVSALCRLFPPIVGLLFVLLYSTPIGIAVYQSVIRRRIATFSCPQKIGESHIIIIEQEGSGVPFTQLIHGLIMALIGSCS